MAVAELDDGFLGLIQSLLTRQRAHDRRKRPRYRPPGYRLSQEDRRGSGRKGYQCWQLAAWYDGKHLPPQADFQLVHCRDLSPEGFSFYNPTLPRHRRLIIALGTAPFEFFEAEVVRRESARVEREDGWVIGCRFTRPLTRA